MMDFGAIEDEIVARLQSKIQDNDIEITTVPENEQEVLPRFGKRKLIVAFASEDTEPSENLSLVQQDTSITFSVLLQGNLLRGESGLYLLAERVKKHLLGFRPIGLQPLAYVSHKFVNNDKKIFQYVVDFKTTTTRVDETEEPEGQYPFKGLTFKE